MRLMIKIVSIFCLGLSLLAPNLALSHSSHGAPLNNQQAIEKAIEHKRMIMEQPEVIKGVTLDDSWQTVTDTKIHKKDVRYFIVSFYNAGQGKTLYVLISANGEFYDANFTGTFKGL
ncbi:MAG: hypothetical protein COA75_03605 [Cellvibrionales bacterium]|nr:MAG: hypothetical protein COA75_03605 [Cellvibrionales bacterium]